ncbi:MAG: hypothetical protein ACI89R_001191 [Candidatus Azotimanducaceae bacterium]|jgi:hypothetical protein
MNLGCQQLLIIEKSRIEDTIRDLNFLREKEFIFFLLL